MDKEKGAGRVRVIKFIYALLAIIFFVIIIVQVFFAGLGVFVSWENLDLHRQLARYIDPLLITMFLLTFFGQIKGRLRWLCLGLSALNSYQYIVTVGPLTGVWVFGALHTVNALLFYWGAMFLMKRSGSWILQRKKTTS